MSYQDTTRPPPLSPRTHRPLIIPQNTTCQVLKGCEWYRWCMAGNQRPASESIAGRDLLCQLSLAASNNRLNNSCSLRDLWWEMVITAVMYSMFHEICTRFGFTWCILPYYSRLFHGHCNNHNLSTREVIWTSIHLADGRLTARSPEVSKPRDSCFGLSKRFEIWHAPLQQCCRDACQISERYDHHNTQSQGFDTSRYLTVRRPSA